jgi:hypothetical protein
MYAYLDSPVILKISPILFDRLKNLRIYESVKMNVSVYFFLPNSCDIHIYMCTARSCTVVSNVSLFRQI